MRSADELVRTCERIDGRGYKAYKDLAGSYELGGFELYIDHVQGDPYAAPSKLRVRVDMRQAQFPPALHSSAPRKKALEDYLGRAFAEAAGEHARGHRGSGKSGLVAVDRPGQEVLERTAVVVTDDYVEVRLVLGLPAGGRRVRGRQAREMLTEELPRIVNDSLYYRAHDAAELAEHVEVVEDQAALREQLDELGLIAFVGEHSVLPRRSRVDDRPLSDPRAVPFEVPQSMRVTVELPNRGELTGMGIPKGVTLIVGGGYHGKSTLLRALERGVYDHVPGDGREWVVTNPRAVKIRAEDGRSIVGVNITPFIVDLPQGEPTRMFSTQEASGSTSQAANIMEALELGAEVLLIDEDTSATNFMIRDARMQRLVHSEHEPITPFIDRVRELYGEYGVSTVVVVGGSGDYFDVADTVIMMKEYVPFEVTEEARAIATQLPTERRSAETGGFASDYSRIPAPRSIDARRRGRVRIRSRGTDILEFGSETIELRAVEQLVDESQTRAVGDMLHYMAHVKDYITGETTLRQALTDLYAELEEHSLDVLSPYDGHPGDYARPRPLEVGAALNRLRTLRVKWPDEMQ